MIAKFPSVLESIADLSPVQIESLLSMAGKFKHHPEDTQNLSDRSSLVATSFLENSTRTKTSFAVAIQRLGATYIDFNAEKSSLQKGESLEETLLTLSAQGIDLCIMRTSVSGQFQRFKEQPPIKLVNAGDGINEHPTQALLDLFTMQEVGLDLAETTMTIVGDIIHSRVGHSLMKLLPQFGVKLILCGPPKYLPSQLDDQTIRTTESLDEAINASNALYLLRIQKERHAGDHESVYDSYPARYQVNTARLARLKKTLPVFHPGPANVGVEISMELLKSPYYFGNDQVHNSIFIRMAIVQSILQNDACDVGPQLEGRALSRLETIK